MAARSAIPVDPAAASTALAANRVRTTLAAALAFGWTRGSKDKRLSGRAHERLLAAATASSGLEGAQLIEYALAKVALEDDFADRLTALRGTVDRSVELEF